MPAVQPAAPPGARRAEGGNAAEGVDRLPRTARASKPPIRTNALIIRVPNTAGSQQRQFTRGWPGPSTFEETAACALIRRHAAADPVKRGACGWRVAEFPVSKAPSRDTTGWAPARSVEHAMHCSRRFGQVPGPCSQRLAGLPPVAIPHSPEAKTRSRTARLAVMASHPRALVAQGRRAVGAGAGAADGHRQQPAHLQDPRLVPQ